MSEFKPISAFDRSEAEIVEACSDHGNLRQAREFMAEVGRTEENLSAQAAGLMMILETEGQEYLHFILKDGSEYVFKEEAIDHSYGNRLFSDIITRSSNEALADAESVNYRHVHRAVQTHALLKTRIR